MKKSKREVITEFCGSEDDQTRGKAERYARKRDQNQHLLTVSVPRVQLILSTNPTLKFSKPNRNPIMTKALRDYPFDMSGINHVWNQPW